MSIRSLYIRSLVVMLGCITPLLAFAQGATIPGYSSGSGGSTNAGQSSGGGGQLLNPLGVTNLQDFLLKILNIITRIGAIVIVFMIVYVGFKFVTARGSESALAEAKRALLYTIIGALILLGAQAIALGIQATVNSLAP